MFVLRLKSKSPLPYYYNEYGWVRDKDRAMVFPTITEVNSVAFDEGLEPNEYTIEEE